MKKYFGLFSSFMILPIFIGVWQLSNLFNHAEDYWDNWVFWLIFYIAFYAIFGNFLRVANGKIKIYRLLWFLSKRNVIEISELKKIVISIKSGGRGGAIIFNIYGSNEKVIGSFLSQMFKFEIKKLKKRLNELGVEVEIIGMEGLMI